jgi:hypothetical protein
MGPWGGKGFGVVMMVEEERIILRGIALYRMEWVQGGPRKHTRTKTEGRVPV